MFTAFGTMTSNKSQTIFSKLHLANKMSALLSATIRAIDHNILCTRFKEIVYRKRWIVKRMFKREFQGLTRDLGDIHSVIILPAQRFEALFQLLTIF